MASTVHGLPSSYSASASNVYFGVTQLKGICPRLGVACTMGTAVRAYVLYLSSAENRCKAMDSDSMSMDGETSAPGDAEVVQYHRNVQCPNAFFCQ